MLPSSSDRHAWLPLGLVVAILLGLAILAGAGPWMLESLAPFLNTMLKNLALLFGLSAVVHAILWLPLAFLHKILAKLTGFDIR
jgi:hypothetical protein